MICGSLLFQSCSSGLKTPHPDFGEARTARQLYLGCQTLAGSNTKRGWRRQFCDWSILINTVIIVVLAASASLKLCFAKLPAKQEPRSHLRLKQRLSRYLLKCFSDNSFFIIFFAVFFSVGSFRVLSVFSQAISSKRCLHTSCEQYKTGMALTAVLLLRQSTLHIQFSVYSKSCIVFSLNRICLTFLPQLCKSTTCIYF